MAFLLFQGSPSSSNSTDHNYSSRASSVLRSQPFKVQSHTNTLESIQSTIGSQCSSGNPRLIYNVVQLYTQILVPGLPPACCMTSASKFRSLLFSLPICRMGMMILIFLCKAISDLWKKSTVKEQSVIILAGGGGVGGEVIT